MNFEMGAYGIYIWPCYLVSAVALVGVTLWSVTAWYKAKAKLESLDKK